MEPERLKWRLFRPIHDPEIVNIGVSPLIDKISGVYGATPVNKINVKKGRSETASAQASDGVEFSGFAKELAKAAQELKKLPDVRENVVEGFRKQIQEGTYAPDPDKVARSLIVAGLLNSGE